MSRAQHTSQKILLSTLFPVLTISNAIAQANQDDSHMFRLEEVVVTAQKREETLLDAPIPVSALSASDLTTNNKYRIQDYYNTVPGMTVSSSELAPTVAIRGIISASAANPTVGVTLDDMPLGSSTQIGGGYFSPEIDPADLARVEVLRGPQGALYGASSMGGLLKYVTKNPSTDAFTGHVQVGTNTIAGGDNSYNINASVNIPVSDTFALRVSAFNRHDGGYIDNLLPGGGKDKDVNDSDISGARIAGMWTPNDDLAIKLSLLYQDNENGAYPYVSRGEGELNQRFLPNSGTNTRTFKHAGLNIDYQIGAFNLISVTSVSKTEFTDQWDYSGVFGPGLPLLTADDSVTDKITQEFRLSTTVGDDLDVLVGAYFGREDSPWSSDADIGNPDGTRGDNFFRLFFESEYDENAFFGTVTYRFTERFDVQIGGRKAKIDQTYTDEFIDPVFGTFVTPETTNDDSVTTYLFSPRYQFDNAMVYARFASGYRAGGFNIGFDPSVNLLYAPDETENFEIGVKGTVLDERLSYDLSLYQIDWSDVQLTLQPDGGGFGYYQNAGTAESKGFEAAIQFAATQRLRLEGWITVSSVELTEDFPAGPVQGVSGDRLPYSTETSAYVAADYAFNVGGYEAKAGVNVSYVGDRIGDFVLGTEAREEFDSYTQVNLTGSVYLDQWELGLYVNNATDEYAFIGGGTGSIIPSALQIIQPRTIGLSISREFD